MSDSILPEGWVWTTIGKITEPIAKVKPKDEPEIEIYYLDIASIDNNINKVTQPKKYFGKDAPSRARQLVKANDVLFSTVRTYLKNIALVPKKFDGQIASTGFSVLRGKTGISNKYLFYYTLTFNVISQLSDVQRGTSYPAIRDSDMREQVIPLAPHPEQKRIVAKIEELFTQLDAGVAALKRAQANLKRYKASVLKAACEGHLVPTEAELHPDDFEPASVLLDRILKERRAKWESDLIAEGKDPSKRKYKEPAKPDVENLPELPEGWVWASFDQLAIINYRDPKLKLLPDDFEVTFLPMKNVDEKNGEIKERITRPLGEVRKGYTPFKENDVLFAKITPCMENGKATIAKRLVNGFGFGSTEFHVFHLFNGVLSEYIFYYVWRNEFRADAKANFSGTAGQLRVKKGFLIDYHVSLPPLAEQNRIVQRVERVMSVIQKQEKLIEFNLTRAERLRQAILKQAFEGKLVPQDPNDEQASVLLERVREGKDEK